MAAAATEDDAASENVAGESDDLYDVWGASTPVVTR